MITMPRSVRVLTQRVMIERVQAITDEKRGTCFGMFFPGRLVVEVEVGHAPDRDRETFLHENLHAVITLAKLDVLMPELDEEKFVNAFSPYLLAWLNENPEAISYLTERSEDEQSAA